MNNYNDFNYQDFDQYPNMRLNNVKVPTNQPNLSQSNLPGLAGNSDLATPYVSYTRGNLFNDLYSEYQNYQPAPLTPRSEREDLLLTINQLTFAARELNLYLDTHPDDLNMLNLFNKYRELADTAIQEYENKYAPFTVSSDYMKEIPFNWVADPWPWEWEGGN